MQDNNKKTPLEYIALLGAFIGFTPMLFFLYKALVEIQQLRDAIIIFISILSLIAIEYKIRPNAPKFTNAVFYTLTISYAFLFFANYGIHSNFSIIATFVSANFASYSYLFSMLLAFSFFVVAIGFSMFSNKRYVWAVSVGFLCFVILSIIFQFADLPLRIWAGQVVGYIFAMFSNNVHLLAYGGKIPQIILQIGSNSYLVATECNGFGIMSACLMMSVVMAVFNNCNLLVKILQVGLGCVLGFIANVLRIISIIVVSITFGNTHYYIYHEALGYLFFIGAIVSGWFMFKRIFGCSIHGK